ncbi:unnamed protein product [Lymnaea stagnalis]|uniref:Uncharacterized protein n=1 Tax=Lymnaea stagnalis TaxID=6523 RepID=A0AAV2HR32_LYMST
MEKNKIVSFIPNPFENVEMSETPDPDSFFGDNDSILSPFNFNTESEPNQHGYHRDPGEVNVHQFYPVLEHSFNRKQFVKKDLSLKAIAEEVQRSDPHSNSSSESGGDASNEEGDGDTEAKEDKNKQENEELRDELNNVDNTIIETTNPEDAIQDPYHSIDGLKSQESVFATAVDEDSLQAALMRNQGTSTQGNWINNKIHKNIKLAKVIHERAYEHYQKAMENTKDPVSVVTLLNKAISLKSDEPQFYVKRAEAFLQLCDLQSSILNYKKACLLEPHNETYYYRLAFLYYFQGQTLFDLSMFAEALESFSRASEMVPENVGYHIRSLSCLAALQRHNECLALVNKRLETDRNNPDLYILRARLHEMFRNSTLCYYDIKDALSLDPNHTEALAMMKTMTNRSNTNKLQAMHLNIAGKHREALQKMTIAIETNPSVADYHVLRGALYRKLNDFNAAIDDFLLALDKCDHNEKDPVYKKSQRQLLLTYNDFAVECFHKGFYDEAIILLNKAIKGEKSEKSLYVNRGDCFYKQGQLKFALEDYHQALELDPQESAIKSRISIIYNDFGVELFQDKKYSEAEAKFSQAIEFNPSVGQYYVSRARCRYLTENMTGAREDLLLGLWLAPKNEEVISLMSRLFPGKSVGDVINSEAAQVAQNALMADTDKAPAEPSNPQTIEGGDVAFDEDTIKQGEGQLSNQGEATKWHPGGSSKSYRMCMEEREFYIQQVKEKKKVELKVKDALINRKSLHYNGGKINALPPPRNHNNKKRSTNWRTFTLGVGGAQ